MDFPRMIFAAFVFALIYLSAHVFFPESPNPNSEIGNSENLADSSGMNTFDTVFVYLKKTQPVDSFSIYEIFDKRYTEEKQEKIDQEYFLPNGFQDGLLYDQDYFKPKTK